MAGHHRSNSVKAGRQKPHQFVLKRLWAGTHEECYNAAIELPDLAGVPESFEGVGDTAGVAIDHLMQQVTEHGYGGQRFYMAGTFEAPTAEADRVPMTDPFDEPFEDEDVDI
ncbi:hypothetical protein BXY66_1601 [Shimia isoporae]|uniref:Uncharacterized protein n=1 Tax=Shimia isoporae TaxID=647720 RepID=A0A4V2Q435_9RHOB|nr:hypothetical protein [Shimia isoporae]TCL09550.1 hypothetical protein BXY66_1601 [Shimia isoporae]